MSVVDDAASVPAVITSPVTSVADLHLFAVEDGPSCRSLLYVPMSDAPALSRDVLRIQRLERSPRPLDTILEGWLAQFGWPSA
jgi:hypothetical protein